MTTPYLRLLRKNHQLNRLVRQGLKAIKISIEKLSNRWRTSGEVSCSFNGIVFKMYNECDDNLVDILFYGREYEEENELALFVLLSQSVDTIIDIGANTGLYTILGAKCNDNATIHSFEPHTPNFERLNKNIRLNLLDNVTTRNLALGDHEGDLAMYLPVDNSITDVASVSESLGKEIYPGVQWKTQRVGMITLDDYAKSLHTVDLIKCDVETFEMNVIKGSIKTLTTHRPVVLIETFLDNQRIEFFNALMGDLNYYAYIPLKDGLLYLGNKISKHSHGNNYVLSPIVGSSPFLSYNQIRDFPQTILLKKRNA